MITLDPAEITALEARAGIVVRTLAWVTAKDGAGDPVSVGLWSGTGTRSFTVDGVSRSFQGPAFGRLEPLVASVGLSVREYGVNLPHLTPPALVMLADYDLRLAGVSLYSAQFAAASRALLANPRRIFRGWIDRAPLNTGAAGGEGGVDLTLVSAVRSLTRRPPLYGSDADQRARDPDDRFAEYVSVAGPRQVRWGQADAKPAGVITAPPRTNPDSLR